MLYPTKPKEKRVKTLQVDKEDVKDIALSLKLTLLASYTPLEETLDYVEQTAKKLNSKHQLSIAQL